MLSGDTDIGGSTSTGSIGILKLGALKTPFLGLRRAGPVDRVEKLRDLGSPFHTVLGQGPLSCPRHSGSARSYMPRWS